jgi:hypothetical protein
MAEMMSTALCNKLLDTGSLKGTFNTAEVRIYSGSVPTTADAAAGTVIAVVKEGGTSLTWAASAAAGVLAKSANTWADVTGTNAGGVATYYRLVNAADDDGATGSTYPRVQGTVGVGGADMNVGTTTIALHANFTLNVFTQSFVPN